MKEAKMIQWINLLVNVILCAVLGITGQVVTGVFSLVGFLQTYFLTLCAGFTLSTWLPVNTWGQKLAAALGCKEGFGAYVITNIFTALVMTALMVFAATFIQAGLGFVQPFCLLIVPFMIMASITALSTSWIIPKIAARLAGIQ